MARTFITPEQKAEIFKLHEEGMGMADISRTANVPYQKVYAQLKAKDQSHTTEVFTKTRMEFLNESLAKFDAKAVEPETRIPLSEEEIEFVKKLYARGYMIKDICEITERTFLTVKKMLS